MRSLDFLSSQSASSAFICGDRSAAEPGPWATYRGNPQRTGNTDNKPGPDKPAVLWVLKSHDHFVAVAGAGQGRHLPRRHRRVQPADDLACSPSPRRTRRSRRGRSPRRT